MISARIQRATRYLGAPPDWKPEENGPCGHLAIRDEATTAGPAMISAWHPTPAELERLNQGASVHVIIVGTVHPPIDIRVGPRPGYDG